jgi:hypothetical protein
VRNEDEFRLNLLRACRGEPRAVACKSYAFNASSSQVSNLSGRCGYSGRRWLDNDDEHLRWCLQAPEAAVTSEAGIRFALLGVCGRGQPFMRCDQYARQAVAQVGEAAARGCGFTGDRWTASYEGHLTWCIGHPDQAAIETREREGPLSQCRTSRPLPGGSPPTVQNDCNWSVRIENATCLNADGTGSSNPPGRFSATGCGGTQATALDRAKLGFGSRFGCLSEGDSPDAGCCTYRKEASLGCACQ